MTDCCQQTCCCIEEPMCCPHGPLLCSECAKFDFMDACNCCPWNMPPELPLCDSCFCKFIPTCELMGPGTIGYGCYNIPAPPKPFKPVEFYRPPELPFTEDTVYRLSYPKKRFQRRKPIKQKDNLCVGTGPFSSETVHSLSYRPYCELPRCFAVPYGCYPQTRKHELICKQSRNFQEQSYPENSCTAFNFLYDHRRCLPWYHVVSCR